MKFQNLFYTFENVNYKIKLSKHLKNYKNASTLFILFGLFFNISSIYSQNGNGDSLLKWFDKTVGLENLELYNGPRHVNFYRTVDNSHSYYHSKTYSKGDVNFQGQNYYDLDLLYDVNNDILVLKSFGDYDYLGMNVVRDKTAYFTLNSRKFININLKNPNPPSIMEGYYEEIVISANNILYIKHHKSKRKVINTKMNSDDNNIISTDEFRDKNEYILQYKDVYYVLRTKNDIIKIFPQFKKEIKKYYESNLQLEESDKNTFTENLLKEINNFIAN